ncbi:hypothetical protein [Salmonella phage SilasIsHot]|nr:hypothetical protein [Salmonella phage SilasIsHot]
MWGDGYVHITFNHRFHLVYPQLGSAHGERVHYTPNAGNEKEAGASFVNP